MIKEVTRGPWHWIIEDHSMALLVGPDELRDHVMAVSPCMSCQESNPKEWAWGRCQVPSEEDAKIIAAAWENFGLVEELRHALTLCISAHKTGRNEPAENAYNHAVNTLADIDRKNEGGE